MKKTFTLLTLCLFFGLNAQQTSNLVVFSEDASLFYIIVNGIKQNIEPKSNVKITGLSTNNNQVLIQFADEKRGTLKKNIYFQEMGVEATAKISYTKKGYKLRYFGEVPIGTAPQSSPNQWTTSYSSTEVTSTNSNSSSTNTTNTNYNTTFNNTTLVLQATLQLALLQLKLLQVLHQSRLQTHQLVQMQLIMQ
jgi:activator of HSP90 ATPase